MRASRALGVGFAPAMFAGVAAGAEPAPFSLSVRAPAECPSTEALRAEVLRLARIGNDSPRRLAANVVVTQAADGSFGLELRTELDGVSGERSFDGSSCQAVSDAAALTLALMLNPEVERAEGAPPEPEPARAQPRPAPATPPAPAPPSPPQPTGSGPELRAALALLGGVQAGILPAAGVDLGVAFGLGLGQASLWLGVSYDPEQDVRLSPGNAGGTLWAGSARLFGCWDFSQSEHGIGPCAGAEIGHIAGIGRGISDPAEGVIYWTSVLLGLSASLEIHRGLHAYATASALLGAERPQVFLEGIGPLHQPESFAGRGQLGVLLDLW